MKKYRYTAEITTPSQLERNLAQAEKDIRHMLTHDGREWAHRIKEAKELLTIIANKHGLKKAPSLLSVSISKLQKDEKVTLGLPLLPATHSGIVNVCAFADSCAETCVAFSGNAGFDNVYKSRMAKTHFLNWQPTSFLVLLTHEIFRAVDQYGAENLAIRLNAYSDIRWEKVYPFLFKLFSNVQFYDYTKHTTKSRPEENRPANYHLTYSVSEKTTPKIISKCADIGRPLAVVVEIRSGVKPGTQTMREIPTTWAGMPTIDGDSNDSRYLTPTGSVVLLRRKHTMKANHPMIVKAAKLEKGVQP